VIATLAVVVLALAPVPAPHVAFSLHDARVDEASGIGVGIASPHAIYVQNDSGDSARFFALDRHGRTEAVYDVAGATNVDWEDLAVATDATGVPSVYLADIGDNDANRDEVQIYRVSEPAVTPGEHTLRDADVWRLRYPHGPVNAEALAVAPGGAMYVITKSKKGRSEVYAVPPHLADRAAVQTLVHIGSFHLEPDPASKPKTQLGLRVTGAAISRDGTQLVIRTYTDAYVWPLSHADVGAALTHDPREVALPLQLQGEGVTFDGPRALLVDSEGVGSPVWTVPIADAQGFPTKHGYPATKQPRNHVAASRAAWWWGGGVTLAVAAVALLLRLRRRAERKRD